MLLPKVYIILVNYNGWEDTIECLGSIYKLDYANFTVIVVDNYSNNESVGNLIAWAEGKLDVYLPEQNKLRHLVRPVTLKPIIYNIIPSNQLSYNIEDTCKLIIITSDKNLGFAGGNNLGIRLALHNQAYYVWLLNNDTVVPKNALTKLVNEFDHQKKINKKIGILGSKLMYYHEPNIIQAIIGEYKPVFANSKHIGSNTEDYGQYTNLEIKQQNYIVGASMFVSSQFIRDVGLMSEDYFLYFEELDWINRGAEKGYKIAVCLDAKVYHKEGASIGGNAKNNNAKSELSDLYSIRNKLLFTKRFFRSNLLTVYFSVIFIVLNRIKRKQFKRVPLVLQIFYNSLKEDLKRFF